MADITTGLVAHWNLDEPSGTIAADSSGNGYNGTYTNSPTLNVAGAFGASKAVTLDGVNDHIAIATNPLYAQSATAFTWAALGQITYAQLGTTYRMAYDDSVGNPSGNNGLSVVFDGRTNPNGLTGSKLLYASFKVAGGTRVFGTASPIADTAAFVHYAITWDGSSQAVYINGVAVATQTSSTLHATGNFVPRNAAAKIGVISDSSGGWLQGTLDDVRIYNRALSAEDVAALFAYARFLPFILDDCE